MPQSSEERSVEPEPAPVAPTDARPAHKVDSLASLSSLGSLSSASSAGYGRQLSQISLSSVLSEYDVTGPGSADSEDESSDSGLELVAPSGQVAPLKRERAAQAALQTGLEGTDEIEQIPEVWEGQRVEKGEVDDEEKKWDDEEKKNDVGVKETIDEKAATAADTEPVQAAPTQPKRQLRQYNQETFEPAPRRVELLVNLAINVLKAVGNVKEYIAPPSNMEAGREEYTPLYRTDDFGGFHARNIFRRWQDCFCNPIDSAATNMVSLMERRFENKLSSRFTLTGESHSYINLGSYNYLGFGGLGPCADQAETATLRYGVGSAAARQEIGTQRLHVQLETLVAEFLGTEDAITFGMGFATNSTNIPSLVGPDCLVISDKMNHASIILGMRLSGAKIRVFAHNDMADLERQLITALTEERRWRKVMIVVEGVYSMEGSIVLLPDVIRLKKKYGAYLYLDEAHSIGAVGATGRGVVEYYGCDPTDVDIMMGTFTKSFGAAGGYIGGSRALVDHLRAHSHSAAYALAMPPCVVQQVIASMEIILGRDGTDLGRRKIDTLARNSHYFRQRLRQMGFIVYGNDDSPVVPLMSFFVSKTAALYRRLKEHGVATAVIAYPATKLTEARARFCLSASHTRQQLDYVLSVVDKVGDELELKYSQQRPPPAEVVY
ncbi:Serine palmitoyltransferase 2 [Amphibalanus amphitrite]|uniref:serine C-palmitoyltransferase n=1 Tax=Amphibalanus amphitrite TaxID=1232801 RepID=A0A6A4W636_AMPAM|nr:Serine palmitoyltransferase 2 [Amphibalanus amphitrite]